MIIRNYKQSKKIKEISNKYNASVSTIYKIVKDHNKSCIDD